MTTQKAVPADEPLPSDWMTGRVTRTLKDGHTVTFRPEITAGESAAMLAGLNFENVSVFNITYGLREFAVYLLDWSLTLPGPADVEPVRVPLPPYDPGAIDTVRAAQIEERLKVIGALPMGRVNQIRKKLDGIKKQVAKQYDDDPPTPERPTGADGSTGSTSETASANA